MFQLDSICTSVHSYSLNLLQIYLLSCCRLYPPLSLIEFIVESFTFHNYVLHPLCCIILVILSFITIKSNGFSTSRFISFCLFTTHFLSAVTVCTATYALKSMCILNIVLFRMWPAASKVFQYENTMIDNYI